MPRHNFNADYHRPRWNHDRVYFLGRDVSETPRPERAILRTTGEQIVREFRTQKAEGRRHLPSAGAENMEHRAIPKPGPFKLPWHKAVNWRVAFEYMCLGVAALAIGYLIVVAFVPFFALLARR